MSSAQVGCGQHLPVAWECPLSPKSSGYTLGSYWPGWSRWQAATLSPSWRLLGDGLEGNTASPAGPGLSLGSGVPSAAIVIILVVIFMQISTESVRFCPQPGWRAREVAPQRGRWLFCSPAAWFHVAFTPSRCRPGRWAQGPGCPTRSAQLGGRTASWHRCGLGWEARPREGAAVSVPARACRRRLGGLWGWGGSCEGPGRLQGSGKGLAASSSLGLDARSAQGRWRPRGAGPAVRARPLPSAGRGAGSAA